MAWKGLLPFVVFMLPTLTFALKHHANYGYVGPACAVANGRLFLHGELQRELTPSEVAEFRFYQKDLSIFRELKKKFPILDPPKMPSYCGLLTDAPELVLDGCIVREGKVYMDNNLVRILTDEEETKVDNILDPWSRRQRINIVQDTSFSEPLSSPLNDFSIFLDKFLKINPTVTKRFTPWFEQSPLVSGRESNAIYGHPFQPPNFVTTTKGTTTSSLADQNLRRRPKSRWDAKVNKTLEYAIAPPPSSPILISGGENASPETSTSFPAKPATAQTLLQLLTKTLTDPELMNTLKELEQLEVGTPVKPTFPIPAPSYPNIGSYPATLKPNLLPHPAVQWFAKTTGTPNGVEEPESLLPDEICTAHLKPPTKKNDFTQ